jgi:hypothetical protein
MTVNTPRHTAMAWALAIITAVANGIAGPIHADELGSTTKRPVPESVPADPAYYVRYWPQGRSALFKLKDNLVLAIPPQYQKFWLQRDQVVRVPAQMSTIPKVAAVGFDFFLPGFTGYTQQNYLNNFDDTKVEVIRIEAADPAQMEPGAPGFYPPNMLKRELNSELRADDYRDQYGLRCYRNHLPRNVEFLARITCYGQRDETSKEDIMLYADMGTSPVLRFPQMQAGYFTSRYGGLHIVWRSNAKNLARWHEIDSQIWKFIDAWKVSDSSSVIVDPKRQ